MLFSTHASDQIESFKSTIFNSHHHYAPALMFDVPHKPPDLVLVIHHGDPDPGHQLHDPEVYSTSPQDTPDLEQVFSQ